MAVLLLDIDNFKRVNDDYGHLAGDQALISIANTLRESFRKVDIFGRYGGEEFIICLPDTPLQAAAEVAERLRQQIEKTRLRYDQTEFAITASIGVTCFNIADQSLADVIKRADIALYRAKNNGRNRVETEAPQNN